MIVMSHCMTAMKSHFIISPKPKAIFQMWFNQNLASTRVSRQNAHEITVSLKIEDNLFRIGFGYDFIHQPILPVTFGFTIFGGIILAFIGIF